MTTADLLALRGRRWRQLAEQLQRPCPLPEEGTRGNRPAMALVLVNCALESLSAEENPQIRQLAERLARGQRCLHVDLSPISVLSPPEADLEDLRFCLEEEDLGAATEALLASADHSCFRLASYRDANFQPWGEPASLLEARRQLERAVQSPGNGIFHEHRRRQAEAQHDDLLDRQLIQPLWQRALDADSPLKANLLLAVADAFRLLHRQHPWLHQKLQQMLKTFPPSAADGKALTDLLKPCQQQAATVAKLLGELKP